MLARCFEFYGAAAHIIPWNHPAQMIGRTVAPALAVGNATVLKPAEDTSLSALRFAQLAAEAGLPEGALNVVTGLGEEAGAALAAHPGIDLVSFTEGRLSNPFTTHGWRVLGDLSDFAPLNRRMRNKSSTADNQDACPARLNTELGFVVDSPAMEQALAQALSQRMSGRALRAGAGRRRRAALGRAGGRQGGGSRARARRRRVAAAGHFFLLSSLPIDWLL